MFPKCFKTGCREALCRKKSFVCETFWQQSRYSGDTNRDYTLGMEGRLDRPGAGGPDMEKTTLLKALTKWVRDAFALDESDGDIWAEGAWESEPDE